MKFDTLEGSFSYVFLVISRIVSTLSKSTEKSILTRLAASPIPHLPRRAGRDERLDERPARAVEVPVAAGVEDEVHAGGEVRGPPVEPEDQRRALLLQQERRGPRLKVSIMPQVEAECIAKIIVDTSKISVSTQ